MKQKRLHDIFKNIALKQEEAAVVSTSDNQLPSPSSQSGVLKPPATFPPQDEAMLFLSATKKITSAHLLFSLFQMAQ